MRFVGIVAAGLALGVVAAPAVAQVGVNPFVLDDLAARQAEAERRAIDLSNQLMAAEARARAEQAVLDLRLQSLTSPRIVVLPAATFAPSAPATLSLPSIPDAMLADSGRRVAEAASNRR